FGLAVISAGVVANLAFEARIRTILVARKAVAEREQAEADGEALRERLEQSRRLEATGKLAVGLAHDVNNVLQCLGNLAQSICDDLPVESSQHQDAALIVSEALAAAKLTKNLLASGRSLVAPRDEIDLDRMFDNVMRLLAPVVVPRRTAIIRRSELTDARVKGDPALLGNALVNLCINACDAMPVGGTIELRSVAVALDEVGGAQLGVRPGKYVAIRVTDQGGGMDPVTQRRAFEPFFTTKPVGKGTGLGLAMVERTMRSHDGAVTLESVIGKGTTVSLYLPIT
ncbi:MAG TPA: ATP-binding protein, partial [Kofleriaceae bacterium]|nr:ATP-binding protein [Kofleriaceae bacterium]